MDLKDTYTTVFLKAANLSHDRESIKKYRSVIWHSLRQKNEGGLRLTEEGYNFIKEKCEIKIYSVPMPKELKISPQIVLWLDHFIDSPFYINKNFIYVLKEKTAFELYLFSGDVKKLGYSKAMSKRLSQEIAE